MSEIQILGLVIGLGLYIVLFLKYVGENMSLFALSVTVGWLFLLQSPLFLQYREIFEVGRWVLMGSIATLCFVGRVRFWGEIKFHFIMMIPLFVLLFMFISTLWSINPSITFNRSLSVALLVVTVLSAIWYMGDTLAKIEEMLKAILLPVIFLFWLLVWIYGFDTSYWSFGLWRTPGPMLNPNGIGGISALLAPAAFYLWRESRSGKVLWMLSFLTFSGMVVLSGMRSALVGIVLAFGFIALTRLRSVPLKLHLVFCLAFLGYLVWETVGPREFLEKYIRMEHLYTASGRFEAWAVAIELIKNKLWGGYGFGTEDILFGVFNVVFKEHRGAYAHNSFLGLGMQIGVIAASLVFLWMIVVGIKGFYMSLRLKDPMMVALEATLIVGLVLSMSESWFYSAGNSISLPFWLLFGALVRLLINQKEQILRR